MIIIIDDDDDFYNIYIFTIMMNIMGHRGSIIEIIIKQYNENDNNKIRIYFNKITILR